MPPPTWLPSLLSAATALVVALTPQLQALLADHPTVTALLAALCAILTHLLPSPLSPPPEPPDQPPPPILKLR